MIKKSWVFLFLLMAVPSGFADPPCQPKPFKYTLDKKKNHAFAPGEKLTYAIKYEFVGAGIATLEVASGPIVNCRPTYQFISRAQSNSMVDAFFVVRDFNSSVSDRDSLASFSFHQNLREGGYKVVRNTTMNYENGTYTFQRERKGKTNKSTGNFAEPAFDVLASFFYIRTLPLELGGQYDIKVFSDEAIYTLKVNVHKKFEDVTVPAGRFECIRLEPTVSGDAIFKARDGKMQIWVTSDERHMPVLIRSKVAVGAFDAELRKFDTPQIDMVNEKVPS